MLHILRKILRINRTEKSKTNVNLYRLLRMNRRMVSPRK